jgi:hypothetical protein
VVLAGREDVEPDLLGLLGDGHGGLDALVLGGRPAGGGVGGDVADREDPELHERLLGCCFKSPQRPAGDVYSSSILVVPRSGRVGPLGLGEDPRT